MLAELEVWHSRPVTPTRRVALGHLILPVDPAPGFGGLLLGAVGLASLIQIKPQFFVGFGVVAGIVGLGRVVAPRPFQPRSWMLFAGSVGALATAVLAKWLFADSEVILFDEPTRGIDVGAKYEIYLLINDLAARGKAILMISSELPEILGMSDRILVMREGRLTGEISDVPNATQEQVLRLMMA